MFTSEWREQTRARLIQIAKNDTRISGGATTGSAAVDQLDAWSDIDLAFGVKNTSKIPEVLESFTKVMYEDYSAVHHLDVLSGSWVYRVFLLSNTLQVDIAFVPEEHFGARASTFKLNFGKSANIPHDFSTPIAVYVGWCWLYALHVRSSLKRNRLWQAEFFISGMRDYLISLYCRHTNLPEKQGRGVDRLPQDLLEQLESTLIRFMNLSELQRAFFETTKLCLKEIERGDETLHKRIKETFLELTNV